jgi:hypothetical protein
VDAWLERLDQRARLRADGGAGVDGHEVRDGLVAGFEDDALGRLARIVALLRELRFVAIQVLAEERLVLLREDDARAVAGLQGELQDRGHAAALFVAVAASRAPVENRS